MTQMRNKNHGGWTPAPTGPARILTRSNTDAVGQRSEAARLLHLLTAFHEAVADTGHGLPSDFAHERPDLLSMDDARQIEAIAKETLSAARVAGLEKTND